MNEFGEVLEKESLKKYSTFGIGGTAKYLIKPYDEKCLANLLKYLDDKKIKYYILGNASNVIIDDSYFDGVIIKLDNLNKINFDENLVEVSAGVMMPKLVNICLQKSFISLSSFSMIPGTVGGSVVGNAGCYGHEIMEYVKSVKVIDKNYNIIEIPKNDISFGYRYTSLKDKYIILSVKLILEKGDALLCLKEIQERNEKRIISQPIDKKSVGSIFRNPEGYSSGKLIDDLGLKGYSIGGAQISEKHANFIVNENNASFNDVIELITLIKEKVKDKYNIDLVVEPTIIKWNEL